MDSASQKVSISASGLVSYTNSNGQAGDWVGIGIPVPAGVSHSAIWTGTNNTVFSNTGSTASYFTQDSTEYLAINWDYNDIDADTKETVKYIQYSFDGGTTVYEIAVDTSGITTNAVDFCGVGLSLDMLKAHPTTAEYTMVTKSGSAKYTVTGIKISDILKYYAPDVKPAALKFGGSTATVYNCPYIGTGTAGSPQYTGYDWSQAMLIWSKKDSSNAESIASGTISSAVNGGGGNMWWSLLTAVTKTADAALTIKNPDGAFTDRFLSLNQLKEHPTTGTDWTMKTTDKTTGAVIIKATHAAITGAAIGTLLTNYTPYPAFASSLYFSTAAGDSYSYKSTTYSGLTAGLDNDFNNGMLAWASTVSGAASDNNLRAALNGGSGMYWYSNIVSMSVSLKNMVIFSVTPANAAVVVKDSTNNTMTPAVSNTYILPDGSYTYTVSASGYTNATGSLTVAGNNQTITKTLTATSGGGDPGATVYNITGYSGTGGSVSPNVSTAAGGANVSLTVTPSKGYVLTSLTLSSGTVKESINSIKNSYSFTMPSSNVTVSATFEPVELTVYVQSGASGTPVVGALFSRSQLENLSTTKALPTTGYIYYKTEEWEAVVATKYVTLDSLLANAGISFGSGDSIDASASDGFYDTISYGNLANDQYYFDPNNGGARTVAPYIIALEHYSGILSGSSLASIISTGSLTTKLRSCYGCSETQYLAKGEEGKGAFGRRLVSSVTSLTIIKSAKIDSNTKDNVTEVTQAAAVDVKTVVTAGKATASVGDSDVTTAMSKITTASQSAGTKNIVEISAISGSDTTKAEVTFSGSSMGLLSKNSAVDGLKIMTDEGNISIDKNTLSGITSALAGNSVVFSLAQAEKSTLTEEQKSLVGDNPVYDLSITAGDKKITNFNGSVTVNLPYQLKEGENPANIAIYHLTSDGKVEKFKAVYDAATKTVTFVTTHFSVYVAANESTAAFSDVLMTDWYYNAVNDAVKKGTMTGTSSTKFEPQSNTTRAMLVTILWRIAGKTAPTLQTSPFTDVKDKTAWYYDAVLWAYQNGIVSGLDKDTFGPTKSLSRQELVAILYRYAKANKSTLTAAGTMNTSQFNDWSNVPAWASEGFQWAYLNGVVSGTSGSTLSPAGNATRAQLASILARYK